MNKEEIKEIIPHREPMLLVDEIYLNEDGTTKFLYNTSRKSKGKNTFLTSMNKVKFKKMVTVGDKVVFTCKLTRVLGAVHFMKAVGCVNNELVMSGDFTFVLN